MIKKEVIKSILEFMEKEMGLYNFKPNFKEQGFIRKDKGAIFFYFFLIYDRTNIKTGEKGFQIEPQINIHIPEIEKYYKEITINSYLKTDWQFITIGNTVANIMANPDGINRKRNQSLDLFVFEEKNIPYVSWELLKYFKEVALPYFLTNNNVKKIDELLNTHPKEYSVHMFFDPYRFIKGTIAAKLAKNPALDDIVSTYSNLIIERDMTDDCKEEMERLKAILPMIHIDG
ncbi:hypothetical protein [Chitinophaga sp. Ak27]|uniref:hypothetical protein n=1 Tax=Chitinophaga sp. Ak27 TaxID=2726116 RepID=UPI00145DC06E|nr:hypothetical protein [Chitinophaga sp. Ak27]NLU91352.1 hypothetical protein [Chitinophaga sp. Ak27]